jgi:hypothetical protein
MAVGRAARQRQGTEASMTTAKSSSLESGVFAIEQLVTLVFMMQILREPDAVDWLRETINTIGQMEIDDRQGDFGRHLGGAAAWAHELVEIAEEWAHEYRHDC